MASIALKKRRIVAVRVEGTSGTQNAPVASTDAVPLIRNADATVTPIAIDRPTLRLSLTNTANIYPGKASVQIELEYEMHANSTFVGDASAVEFPLFYRLMRGCAYSITQFALGTAARGFKVTSVGTDNGPLRHDELVTGTGVTSGNGWRVYGDCYSDDGLVFVIPGAAGTLSGTTLSSARGASETVFNIVSTQGPIVYGWDPQSDVNAQEALSIDVYVDNKRMRARGCMGNTEFRFRYGDAIVAAGTYQGIFVDYTDTAIPGAVNEAHKYPPTFLGPRLTIRRNINLPSAAEKYGSGGSAAAGIEGSLSEMNLNTGNAVVLRPNAFDPNGVPFAIVTGRDPSGSFNPDEVLSTEFDWASYFIAGTPVRMRTTVIGPDSSAVVFDDPNTANQNIYDWITPGVTISELADGDRDAINTWNGTFKLRGGDYDQSATGEAPGSDNELVVIHR